MDWIIDQWRNVKQANKAKEMSNKQLVANNDALSIEYLFLSFTRTGR